MINIEDKIIGHIPARCNGKSVHSLLSSVIYIIQNSGLSKRQKRKIIKSFKPLGLKFPKEIQ